MLQKVTKKCHSCKHFRTMSPSFIVPDPPHGIKSITITTTLAEISWDAPVPAVNTPISDIDHYKLRVYEHQFNLSIILVNTTESSYLFTGLEEYVNYTCEIAAVNRVGLGQYSAAYVFLTQQAGTQTTNLPVCLFD